MNLANSLIYQIKQIFPSKYRRLIYKYILIQIIESTYVELKIIHSLKAKLKAFCSTALQEPERQ